MSDKSKISWTEATWQPVVGCTKVSAGCENCYAEKMAVRCAAIEHPKLEAGHGGKYNDVIGIDGKWNGRVFCDEFALDKPLHWKKPRRIFVCSMGDLFHPGVPFEFIDKVMAIIALCYQHTFQILTKRPERMLDYFGDGKYPKRTYEQIQTALYNIHDDRLTPGKWRTIISDFSWKRLWLGTTCENQEMADKRIPQLLQIPAAVRFISVEPMLGPVDFNEVDLGEFYCPQCRDWFDAPGRWVSPCCGADTTDKGHENDGTLKCTECQETFEADEEIPECPVCQNQGGGRHIQPDYCGCFSGDKEGAVLEKLNWLIIGCESGPNRRPCNIEWVRDLVAQCDAAGVAPFVKQLNIDGKVSKNPEEWPEDLRRQEYPKEQ